MSLFIGVLLSFPQLSNFLFWFDANLDTDLKVKSYVQQMWLFKLQKQT